jgi:hypothetical protein
VGSLTFILVIERNTDLERLRDLLVEDSIDEVTKIIIKITDKLTCAKTILFNNYCIPR